MIISSYLKEEVYWSTP